MSETYAVPERVSAGSPNPIRTLADWREAYMAAQADPSGFWLDWTRKNLAWETPPTRGLDGDFYSITEEPIRWFADGKLDVTVSCLDRHLETRGDKTAILWEGDAPGDVRRISYRELHHEVCRMANVLADLGVKRGERVIIYMGMVPEVAVAMLACARLGAIHSVVFGGFSAESLRDRINDCGAELVITQDEGKRGSKAVALKAIVDKALPQTSTVQKVLVYKHTGGEIAWTEGRDVWWHEARETASPERAPLPVGAEDPLFLLYTSGSTGKPKGLVHTRGGYLTFAAYTHRTVFDLREDDVYACVADVGWVTGHSYIVYGPLANGATTVMFESVPTYPDAGRYWDMVQRLGITIFYGAPTALRVLAAEDASYVTKYDRSSLRVLGSVGEPISPAAWVWYHDVVGEKRCTIVDTWWQTETGGIAISPIAPATPTKPGSATYPLPGIEPRLISEQGQRLYGPNEGRLCIAQPWPGLARTVWGDHARYVGTYFSTYPGFYFSGDGARRDADGYYWITGRVDDVINVSGHRMGTAEFESALTSVEEIAEAAVVGFPHAIKGQGVYAYLVLQPGAENGAALEKALQDTCRRIIGAHARVDAFQFVEGLPKTRSGKVMRRILRKIAEGDVSNLGDISTLADPSVVEAIVKDVKPAG